MTPGTTDCAFWGRCKATREALPRGCDPDGPVIFLYDHVKCCHKNRYVGAAKMVSRGLFDVAIVTGDEYCSKLVKNELYDFRNYYSAPLMSSADIAYVPLGPRIEMKRVTFEELKRTADRAYLFNFVGSLT